MRLTRYIFIIFFPLLVRAAPAPGNLFTYEGILTDSSGVPITTSQTLNLQIIISSSCVLLEETQDVTPGAMGEFSVIVGTGTRRDTTSNSASRIFASSGTVECNGAGTQTVNGFVSRNLRIKVGSVTLTPDVVIGNIPMAINAQRLNDSEASSDKTPGTIALRDAFGSLAAAGFNLFNNLNHSLNLKLSSSASSDYSLIWPATDGASGQVLATDGAGNLSWTTPASSGGSITSIYAGTGLNGGVITSTGTLSLATTGVSSGTYGSANTVPIFAVDSTGRIISASSQNPSFNAAVITEGALSVANGGTGLTAAPSVGQFDIGNGAGFTRTLLSGDIASVSSTGVVALASSGVTAGTYNKVIVDSKGRVVSGASLGSSDVTNALTFNPVNKAGDSMTGAFVTFSGTATAPALGIGSSSLGFFNAGTNILGISTAGVEKARMNASGSFGIGTTSPTARLHLAAGSSIAGTAPLKFNAGPVLTTAEAGAVEFDGTSLFYTNAAGTRQTLSTSGGTTLPISSGGTGSTTGSIVGSAALSFSSGGSNSSITLNPSGTGSVILNGNVGVGTTTPSYKLDVVGDVNVSGNFRVNGATLTGGTVTAVSAGTGLSGGPITSSGTLSLSLTGVSAGTYGSAGTISQLVVDATGRITAASSLAPSFNASVINAGTLGVANGGTGFTSYAVGDLLYASSSGVLGKLGIGTSGFVLTSNGSVASWQSINASGLISGSGTINYVPYYSASATLADSPLVITGSNVGIGTTAAAFKLSLAGTGTPNDRKMGINGTQVVYLPDQASTAFVGSLFIGDGGGSLSSGGTAQGTYDTAIGLNALMGITTGSYSTAVGASALKSNTTGSYNTATGYSALMNNTTGLYNTGIGTQSLQANLTGSSNFAGGNMAMSSNTNGSFNVALGANSLKTNSGKSFSTAIGANSMANADSSAVIGTSYNTAVGAYSLQGSITSANNTGIKNTALGHSALMGMTSGSGNIGIGFNSGSAITAGSNNVVIGSNDGAAIATSSNNILISDGAGIERMRFDGVGNVGIGTTLSMVTLDVKGQMRTKSASVTTAAIDFSQSNVITTSASCANITNGDFTFSNLLDGGAYTLVVTNSTNTKCNFSTLLGGSESATVSYKFFPANDVRVAGSDTIYSLQRVGNTIYVSWITGFQ